MLKQLAIAILTIASFFGATLPSVAHANEWEGVHPGYYFQKGELITPDKINYRDTKVQPHCEMFTKETTPGRWRTILGHGATQGVVGGISLDGQELAETKILGETLVKNANPALMAAGFVGNVLFGGLAGNTLTNERLRSGVVGCLVRDAGGIYSLAPSEAKQIMKDGKPRTASVSSNWMPDGKQSNPPAAIAAATTQ